MKIIDSCLISEALYNLCIQANTSYSDSLYNLLLDKFHAADGDLKLKYSNILKNIKLAFDKKRPLCQDTGQVIVFVEIGKEVFVDANVSSLINDAVSRAYCENFYRKSVVKNAIFDRTNSGNNTPAIIYYDFIDGDAININLLVKGAGSENYSKVKMFSPADGKEEIFKFVKSCIEVAGEKSCPPYVLGLGIGGTMDYASVLSKKAFFNTTNSNEEKLFISDLKRFLNSEDLLDIKISTASTHIAMLPVSVTINCHSTRDASCIIKDSKIFYNNKNPDFFDINFETSALKEVNSKDIDAIRNLKPGEVVLLTGEIYTARDAAHKLIYDKYKSDKTLLFDLKDKIIFYAGPCPAAEGEIIGPIGPTTSARMDKYCDFVYSKGLLATIGKGERSIDAEQAIRKYNGKYFVAQGGISCLLSSCVKKSEVIAFEDLCTEAIRKLYVEKFPVIVKI